MYLDSGQGISHTCPYTMHMSSDRCHKDGHHALNITHGLPITADLNHGLAGTKPLPDYVKEPVVDQTPIPRPAKDFRINRGLALWYITRNSFDVGTQLL